MLVPFLLFFLASFCLAGSSQDVFDAISSKKPIESFEITAPFDDTVDLSGLRRYPIHLAIQTGDHFYTVHFVLGALLWEREEAATNLMVKDAHGWGVLEYAAAYQPTLLEPLFKHLESAGFRHENGPVPPFDHDTRDRLLRIAFRDTTKTHAVIKAVMTKYAITTETLKLFARDAEQDSRGLFDVCLRDFFEIILNDPSQPAPRLKFMVDQDMVAMLKIFLAVFHDAWLNLADAEARAAFKATLGAPSEIGDLLFSALKSKKTDQFFVLLEHFPEALPHLLGKCGNILPQDTLHKKIMTAMVVDALCRTNRESNFEDLAERYQLTKETELIYKALFKGTIDSLLNCADLVVDSETQVTVFEVALAYRRSVSPDELAEFFKPPHMAEKATGMILELFVQSKRGELCLTPSRRIWVLKIVMLMLREKSPLEFFAHFIREGRFYEEIKYLSTIMIDSGKQKGDYLFSVLLGSCTNKKRIVEFFKYFCRLQRGATWISQKNFVQVLEAAIEVANEADTEEARRVIDIDDFVELLHEAYWKSKGWVINEAFTSLMRSFVDIYSEAEVLLRIKK